MQPVATVLGHTTHILECEKFSWILQAHLGEAGVCQPRNHKENLTIFFTTMVTKKSIIKVYMIFNWRDHFTSQMKKKNV